MTDNSEVYRIGYGKPPKETRWRKGQSGNPRSARRRSANATEGMADIIDRLLAEPVQVKINGVPTKMTALEAIAQHLTHKLIAGNSRALRVLLDYVEYFQRHQPAKLAQVVFIEGGQDSVFSPHQVERTNV